MFQKYKTTVGELHYFPTVFTCENMKIPLEFYRTNVYNDSNTVKEV